MHCPFFSEQIPSTAMSMFGPNSSAPVSTESDRFLPFLALAENGTLAEVPLRNRCFCNYGPSVCEFEDACIKHTFAACFHAVVQEYSSESGSVERRHFFGCAPLEKGSGASHLTCNAWRAAQANPRSIVCCYEGNFCNANLTLPDFPNFELTTNLSFSPQHRPPSPLLVSPAFAPFAFLLFGSLVSFCLLFAFAVPFRCWLFKKKRKGILSGEVGSSTDSATALLKLSQQQQQKHSPAPPVKQHQQHFATIDCMDTSCSSASGAHGMALIQRSIALDLQLMEVFARGRYGELRKALYRGTLLAVKIFCTTEEESWLNERDIYQSQMLNHENILQFVAADILSGIDSLTQMMLITDFHPMGSLYDFLRADILLSLDEALQLALSTISGLEHLHNALRGTAGREKPQIAHRDIKSKNVLVKRRGVCCVADFGLAVRCEDGQILPRNVNIKVGTKRYMAPELLLGTLNVRNFDAFKSADIYSFALVLWEILDRVHLRQLTAAAGDQRPPVSSCVAPPPVSVPTPPPPASSIPLPHSSPTAFPPSAAGGRPQQMLNGWPSSGSSSGFASSGCSADRTLAMGTLANSLPMGGGQKSQPSAQQLQQLNQRQRLESEVSRKEDADGAEDAKGRRKGGSETHSRQHREHSLPFMGMVDNDPSFEQMRQIVCVQKLRPPMKNQWTDGANPVMHSLYFLMTECWSEQWHSRHTALKVKKELMHSLALWTNSGDGKTGDNDD